MGAQTKFTIPALSTNEAWKLYKDMARISNDTSHTSTDLYITQKTDATECGGLSVVIVTVAWALNDKDRHSWNSALQQLSRSLIKNIRRVKEKVFKSLELSYNYLESTRAKKCFLLYSLYPEDFDIPIEYLVRYGVGIELFEAVDSVNETRDRVHASIDELKKGYLLIDSEVKSYVKMHDVIRDVAMSIASKEEHSFMLEDNYTSELPKLPYSFYRGMKKLKALNMLNVYIEGSLPTLLSLTHWWT
ncbi:disease resistance protein At4g27190-like [Camellia sinensis]|uniref:disease resistance protein At4g27190-like n=1 Tax=Camellia sinensis TaxID=4442 RepID=UPI001035CE3F|nr:disease resistance protein At4g27190-like [Camellia sinensis]